MSIGSDYQLITGLETNKKNQRKNCYYFLTHNFFAYVLGAQKNRLIEAVLLSTHKICFGWEIRKFIFCYALLTKVLQLMHLMTTQKCQSIYSARSESSLCTQILVYVYLHLPWNQTSDVHRGSTLIMWRWRHITWRWRHRNHAYTIPLSIAAKQTVTTSWTFHKMP